MEEPPPETIPPRGRAHPRQPGDLSTLFRRRSSPPVLDPSQEPQPAPKHSGHSGSKQPCQVSARRAARGRIVSTSLLPAFREPPPAL